MYFIVIVISMSLFNTDVLEIGKTETLQCDIEIPRDTQPIHLPQYKNAYQYINIING